MGITFVIHWDEFKSYAHKKQAETSRMARLRNMWNKGHGIRIPSALFSAASMISRSPGPLSLMPQR